MLVEVINYKMLVMKDIGHVNIDDRHYTSSHGSDGGLDGHENIHDSEFTGMVAGDSDDNDGGGGNDNVDVNTGDDDDNEKGDNDDGDDDDDDDDDGDGDGDDDGDDDDDDDDEGGDNGDGGDNDDDEEVDSDANYDDQEKCTTPSATLSRGDKLPTVPLYQGAPISVKASWLATNYFTVTNNLSDSTTEQLLDLIAIHCPKTNLFARSTFQLRNKLNCDESDIFMYCSRCMNKIVKSKKCDNLVCNKEKAKVCYLAILPFEQHLCTIFTGKTIKF